MGYYIFRMPADTPRLTFDGLIAYLAGHWYPDADGTWYGKIGTTVRLRWHGADPASGRIASIGFELYGLRIAEISRDTVTFPGPDDPHLATTAWLRKIAEDNGFGPVFRIRRRKADGPGPAVPRGQAGLLVIAGHGQDYPVFGHSYPARPRS